VIQKTGKSFIEEAYGEKLAKPIPFDFEYSEYETVEEAKAAGDWLNEEKILGVVNAKRLAKSRQDKMVATRDAANIVKPTLENNEQFRLKEMVKGLLASKLYTEEEAWATAETALKVKRA